jgi:hypothetical protein
VQTSLSSKVLGNHVYKFGAVHAIPCYTPVDNSEFPIALPTNEDGLVNEEEKTSKQYLEARNGDNLSTPFQCDTCHLRNLMH